MTGGGYLQESEPPASRNGNQPPASGPPLPAKITVPVLRQMKANGQIIAGLTCYDYTMAAQLEQAGLDLVLVGDSLGCVVQGHSGTLPVQVDDVVYHTRCVGRALNRTLLIADLPFSCMYSVDAVVRASVRMVAESGAAMVKLEMNPEGRQLHLEMIRALSERAIPVCAHLGLTPQSVHAMGGYRVQGKQKATRSADQLLEASVAAEEAGASLIVLECVPRGLAAQITKAVGIPTIGIGAGPDCDGQLLVMPDMLGLHAAGQSATKFVKNFLAGRDSIQAAFQAYVKEVREGQFPADQHSYH